jgi:hypothetical protein
VIFCRRHAGADHCRRGVRYPAAGFLGAVVVLVTMLAVSLPASASQLAAARDGVPPIRHVWLIMLENHSFPENFGKPAKTFKPRHGVPESMAYLATTLPSQDALLDNYFGVAHPSNANYTALLSGQSPSFGYFSNGLPQDGDPLDRSHLLYGHTARLHLLRSLQIAANDPVGRRHRPRLRIPEFRPGHRDPAPARPSGAHREGISGGHARAMHTSTAR